MEEPTPRLRHFLPALLLLAFSAFATFAVTLGSPKEGSQMAVVAPPWYSMGETVSLVVAAGGRIVETGGFGNVLVAASDDPRFSSELYQAGAWLVVDPIRLRGCLGLAASPARMEGRG